MVVLKFGGSSVGSAAGIARVCRIVHAQLTAHPIVVVSAMAETTSTLLRSAEAAAAGNLTAAMADLEELRDFHRREAERVVAPARGAALATALERCFGELRAMLEGLQRHGFLAPREADAVAGLGEILASTILALALPTFQVAAFWLDGRQVVVTDNSFTNAKPLYEETEPRLRAAILPAIARGLVPVLGGYIGATRDGAATTLGREGSDFSATIVGSAVGASEVQIWTDVDGLLTADPRLVPNARRIRTLSFAESLELACAGAKKPHPGALGPAVRTGVPIRILSSLELRSEGTLIGQRSTTGPAVVKSLACRPNDLLLHVFPSGTADAGFTGRVLAVVDRFRPALLVLHLDEAAAHLALDRKERLSEVQEALGTAEVHVVSGCAVVSLVSDDLAADSALVASILAAASEFQPRLVVAGAAAPAVRCLVRSEDLAAAVSTLHNRIFPQGGIAVID
jgi:aspartate kinase